MPNLTIPCPHVRDGTPCGFRVAFEHDAGRVTRVGTCDEDCARTLDEEATAWDAAERVLETASDTAAYEPDFMLCAWERR